MGRTLRRRVVVGCWVDKVTSDQIADRHRDRKRSVGSDGVSVLGVRELGGRHPVGCDDAAHLQIRLGTWYGSGNVGKDVREQHCNFHP